MKYEIIKPYIEKKLISEQAHPEDANVRIFNYTQHCQFEHAWDDVTKQCRGLIMNVKTGEILARPFAKFFNYGEHITKGWPIPAEVPIVTEKLDGSLGILYQLGGKEYIATRGSFTSDQALWATKWWRENIHPPFIPIKGQTHLFEIIYPENRIVVNYDFSGLVHLATIETATGLPYPMDWFEPVRKARVIPAGNLEELAKLDEPNSEGFVAFFPTSGTRIKIKFPEYVRLHKLVTGVSSIAIWEHLRDGKGLDDLLEKVPDEFFAWVKETEKNLRAAFALIEDGARKQFEAIQGALLENVENPPRAAYAVLIKQMVDPGLGFAMLDKKDYRPMIWRQIRPRGRSFKKDIDL